MTGGDSTYSLWRQNSSSYIKFDAAIFSVPMTSAAAEFKGDITMSDASDDEDEMMAEDGVEEHVDEEEGDADEDDEDDEDEGEIEE